MLRRVRLDLGPEFSGWGGHNISIINNTVRDCNYLDKARAAGMIHGVGNNAMAGYSNIIDPGLCG